MGTQIWNEKYQHIEIERCNGTKKLNGTLANSAVVDNGDGTVNIVITAHGLTAGCKVLIAATTNYNGVHTVISAPDANTIKIAATYVAETPAGTETWAVCFNPPVDFQLFETRLVLGGAAAVENYTVNLDAYAGATYDCTLLTVAMSALTQNIKVWIASDERRVFEKGDVIYFGWANANNRAWTLTNIYRRKA
jgi:hypothetical protein